MSRFRNVPWWWYAATTLIMLGIALGVTQGYPTELSWWALFISLIIAVVWFVPLGIVKAATNVDIGLNVITEFVVGYMQPGKPMAMMLFKTYGYITMSQGLYFCQDMKLGMSLASVFPYTRILSYGRILHENPSKANICHANGRMPVVLHCANRRHELGAQHHPRCLLLHPSE